LIATPSAHAPIVAATHSIFGCWFVWLAQQSCVPAVQIVSAPDWFWPHQMPSLDVEPPDEPLDEPPDEEPPDEEPPDDEPPDDEPPDDEPPDELELLLLDDDDPPLLDEELVPLGAEPVPLPPPLGSVPNCDDPVGSNSSVSFAPPQAARAKATSANDERARAARFIATQDYPQREHCPMRGAHPFRLNRRPRGECCDTQPANAVGSCVGRGV
jgi:hypothetical protein